MRQAQPLQLKQAYFREIEREVNKIFYDVIYKDLAEILKVSEKQLKNQAVSLASAISEGTVYFDDGVFRGQFNSKISRELRDIGAKYLPKSGGWSFKGILPPEVSIAQNAAAFRFQALQSGMLRVLDTVSLERINDISDVPDVYNQVVSRMNTDFEKTLRGIAIPPKLTQEAANILSADWGYNLDLYIREWADSNIIKLRQDIQDNVFQGRRSKDMVDYISNNYKVSRRKAKFLARQETSLLLSKFKENRYKDSGITKYRWSTTGDKKVRDRHDDLDNKVFTWDNPPVVDLKSGRKAHPGEDFNCRCVAVPIIE